MSTAAEPAQLQTPSASSSSSMLIGSLLGALLVLTGFVAGGFAAAAVRDIPYLEVARIAVYLTVVLAGIALGGFLAGRNPAPGVSGGIILTVTFLAATAFIASAFAINFKDGWLGSTLAGLTIVAGGFAVFRVLTSQTGKGWCRAIDEQGWASFHSHKRSQGLTVRRLTMVGILIIGMFGAYSLSQAKPFSSSSGSSSTDLMTAGEMVPDPLNYIVPFVTGKVIPLLPVADYTLPVLIAMLSVWVTWRAVNVPVFGDFLIATEAEMNKVSWTSRKQLVKDTIVVLVFLALLTTFLFLIDMFWSWLLSLKFIGVLPSKEGTDAATAGKLSW